MVISNLIQIIFLESMKPLSRAEFIEIVVSNDNDAITLFETVNARGKGA